VRINPSTVRGSYPDRRSSIPSRELEASVKPCGVTVTTDQKLDYLTKRARNNAYWVNRALEHGGTLSATASTSWVRTAVLRRLRKIVILDSLVLEVGCGNARSLLGPLSCDREAYGIDLTMEMLSVAKQSYRRVRGFVRSDACYVPFRDASFDFVYTSRCLINVLDGEMQRLAIREAFRVVKPTGTVIFVENFEEPLTRMNLARQRYGARAQISDQHNLTLNLQQTLAYSKKLGWNAVSIQGNTLASFAANIIFGRLMGRNVSEIGEPPGVRVPSAKAWRRIRRTGGQTAEWAIYLLYLILTWLDDCVGTRLPLLGKDVMIAFRRA
jgi:ubiquinone/menaquinone biosynthesis C-methylase UbiE